MGEQETMVDLLSGIALEGKMSSPDEQDMGKLELVRGGLYGRRPRRRSAGTLASPRFHLPRDRKFSRRVAGVCASWKSRGGAGPYASRAIANAAQNITVPMSKVDRMLRDAIEADVPLHRVEEIAFVLLDRIRELDAAKRRLKPAA